MVGTGLGMGSGQRSWKGKYLNIYGATLILPRPFLVLAPNPISHILRQFPNYEYYLTYTFWSPELEIRRL